MRRRLLMIKMMRAMMIAPTNERPSNVQSIENPLVLVVSVLSWLDLLGLDGELGSDGVSGVVGVVGDSGVV